MRPVSDFFLVDNAELSVGDDSDSMKPRSMLGAESSPRSAKSTPTDMRVPLQELELTYIHNPTIFNGVNKTVQVIMHSKPTIEAKDKRVQEYFRTFVTNLGNSGSQITWDILLSSIFQHQFMYGRSFVENIFNTKGNRIVDWDMIDPKKMDYAKDAAGKIVFDKFNNPVGYFESIPYGEGGKGNPNAEKASTGFVSNAKEVPEGVATPASAKSIYLGSNRVAHLKLYTVGDGFYGIGLIEPIYKTSLRKLNLEEAHVNAIYRHGNPIVWAQLGDLNHEPTPQQIENMTKKLKDMTFKTEITTPYYYQLHILESKKSEKIKDSLDYFRSQELAGLGIPAPFVTGGADGSSYGTLGKQAILFDLSLIDIIKRTSTAIEKQMFLPICKLEGFKEVPKLKWDMVGIEELDKKAERILKYIGAGLLGLDDTKVVEYVKRSEHLD
jgi:hypothetical protein